MVIGEKSLESYICRASDTTVEVRQEGSRVTGLKGLPKMSRSNEVILVRAA
jgi:hypothetical protein